MSLSVGAHGPAELRILLLDQDSRETDHAGE
jgi:hypothetical protein